MNQKIEIGDVVVLKSDGPLMTVNAQGALALRDVAYEPLRRIAHGSATISR